MSTSNNSGEFVNENALNDMREPLFIYRGNRVSKVNVELVKKYPGSYFYSSYMSNHRTADGDIYIDIDGENDELIVKYMKDDESLIDDLKKMNDEERRRFLDDLTFLKLPIKKEFVGDFGHNEEKEKTDAKQDRRVVMVNGRNAPMLNTLLKQRHLFDHVFDSQPKEDICYFEEVNIYYINLKMKYYDLIECYLKYRKFNIVLIKKYKNDGNFDVDELIKEMKMLGIELNEKDEYTLYYDKEEPSFVYCGNRVSKVDVELVKKYPGSYFYSSYMSNRRTADGDVFFDMDGKNDELIVKYMKNDESLIDDLKKMNIEERRRFLDDLNYFQLPIKMGFVNELCCNEDNEIMEAWKNRKVLLVNNEYNKDFIELLKKNQLLDTVFKNQNLGRIQYIKPQKSFTLPIHLKFYDVIVDCLKNGKIINEELIEANSDNGDADELINEMEMIGIELNDEKKEEIRGCFYQPLFMNISNIINDKKYDKCLQKWVGEHKWKMIYRASEHGYTAKSFHEHCNNVTPTLVIIKSHNDCIFGGYTTQTWKVVYPDKYGGIYYMITL